jgi:hypothetical protein
MALSRNSSLTNGAEAKQVSDKGHGNVHEPVSAAENTRNSSIPPRKQFIRVLSIDVAAQPTKNPPTPLGADKQVQDSIQHCKHTYHVPKFLAAQAARPETQCTAGH